MRIATILISAFLSGCTVQNIPGKLQDHKCLEFGGKGQCVCYWRTRMANQSDIEHYTEMSCQAAEIAGFRIEPVKRNRGGGVD